MPIPFYSVILYTNYITGNSNTLDIALTFNLVFPFNRPFIGNILLRLPLKSLI